MRTREEVVKELNQYAKEINETIRSEPDEITGYRNFDPVFDEFLTGRGQPTVLVAYFNQGSYIAIDMYEPLSKKLVAERMLWSVRNLLDLSKKHIEKLEEYLAQGEQDD